MTHKWQNYATRGYSEHDGLGEGHWEPIPGTAGVQRWVGQLEAKSTSNSPRGMCVDCEADIDHRSQRCRRCAGQLWNEKRWGRAS